MLPDDPPLAASETEAPPPPRGPGWLVGVLITLHVAGCASLFLPRPWWKLATGILFGTASTLLERRQESIPTLEELGNPRNRRQRRRAQRQQERAARADGQVARSTAGSTAVAGMITVWVADHFGSEIIDQWLRQPTFAIGFGAFLVLTTLYAWWSGKLH